LIESVAGDIRFALRHLARTPLTATTIVLVLSIGIGVHAGVFSLNASLATWLPARHAASVDPMIALRTD
jgi:formate hydrogenlyase subunit 3/multisubunit Na+/H+ antiporter MnhD subunit